MDGLFLKRAFSVCCQLLGNLLGCGGIPVVGRFDGSNRGTRARQKTLKMGEDVLFARLLFVLVLVVVCALDVLQFFSDVVSRWPLYSLTKRLNSC